MTKHFPLHKVNGVLVPRYVTQEAVDKLKDVELRPDDVWLVGYPKTGTTWTAHLMRLIRNRGLRDDKKVSDAVVRLEGAGEGIDFSKLPAPRLFKSHFPYGSMPCGPPDETPCKYIVVTRNPKDVAVSGYYQTKLGYLPDLKWDDFWKQFFHGEMLYGDFFDHLLGWLEHKDDKKMLFLKYEDMKENLPSAVAQIASFMEIDLSDEVITKIAESGTFMNMKNDDTANYSWYKAFDDEDGKPSFLRKGLVGDWKNLLTTEQSSEMDQLFAQRVAHTGFKFDYE